jgi:hypothetical protein
LDVVVVSEVQAQGATWLEFQMHLMTHYPPL